MCSLNVIESVEKRSEGVKVRLRELRLYQERGNQSHRQKNRWSVKKQLTHSHSNRNCDLRETKQVIQGSHMVSCTRCPAFLLFQDSEVGARQ